MTPEKSSKLLDELLKVIHPLAETHPIPSKNPDFLRLIEGTFRRNYVRLLSITELCSNHPMTPSSALELVRNMVEDVIGVEYILLKGKDKYAKLFTKYIWVQLYEDMLYARSLNIKVDQGDITDEDLEKKYNKLPSKLKERKNWAGIPFEEMLEIIAKSNVLQEREIHIISRFYIEGSRKTHFNPYEVRHWMNPEFIESGSNRALLMATTFAVLSAVRITNRYIDEINEFKDKPQYLDIAKAAKAVLDKYPTKEASE